MNRSFFIALAITSTSLFLGQVNAQAKQENVNMQIFEATKYIANNKMKYCPLVAVSPEGMSVMSALRNVKNESNFAVLMKDDYFASKHKAVFRACEGEKIK